MAGLVSSPETAGMWAGMRVSRGRGSPNARAPTPIEGTASGAATATEGEEEDGRGGPQAEVVAGEGVILEAREGVILETLLTPLAALMQPSRSGARCRLLRLNVLPHAHPDAFAMARAARALTGGTQFTCFTSLLY